MTGIELIEFLQTLDEDELECDVEIKIDYKRLTRNSFLWVAGAACDCNGIYICDEGGLEEFEKHMLREDKVSWEVENDI